MTPFRVARNWSLQLKSKPFDEVVGIEFGEQHEDGVTLRLTLRDEHLNTAGVVHGGVTFTLADSAVGHAVTRIVGERCTTAELKINFLKPATEGVLTARSRILRKGRRLVVARAEVHCGDAHIAEVLTTFAVLD